MSNLLERSTKAEEREAPKASVEMADLGEVVRKLQQELEAERKCRKRLEAELEELRATGTGTFLNAYHHMQ